jgi:hypothetical protein
VTTPIDNSKQLDKTFAIKGNSTFLSKPGNNKSSSDFANEVSLALDKLSKLDNSEKLRQDAIKNGKAIVENWKSPTDTQIDMIMKKMTSNLILLTASVNIVSFLFEASFLTVSA